MTIEFDIDPAEKDFPVQTDPYSLGRSMARDHESLTPEQDKREPFVNSIEHGATVFVADADRVAARTIANADGLGVMRRTWVDNATGFPRSQMATLIRNFHHSSKPSSSVYSGNHGQGVILANGMANPAGQVFLSKAPDEPEPYMAYWWRNPTTNNWGLRGFWIDDPDSDDEDPTGENVPVVLLSEIGVLDGIDWQAVWDAAFNIKAFNFTTPDSGTVVVEIGATLTDSTYVRSQRNYDGSKDEWVQSRWATGQFYNSHFWTLPIEVYWGVAKTGFDPMTFDEKQWEYRRATGLREQIGLVTREPKAVKAAKAARVAAMSDGNDDELPVETTTTIVASTHIDGPVPATVEVHIRELPEGVEARKLNFQVRRRGLICVDYNGELFHHPTPTAAHSSFGMLHSSLKENVWVRIIPDTLGEPTPGAVWMPSGRGSLNVHTAAGTATDFPWADVGRAFKKRMPQELMDLITKLDSGEGKVDELLDKKYRSWWEKIAPILKRRKVLMTEPGGVAPTGRRAGPIVPDQPGGKPGEPTGRARGPVVNPGKGTHGGGSKPETDIRPRRKRKLVPGQTTVTKLIDTPDPSSPKPPMVVWVKTEEDWGIDEMRYAVRYSEPDPSNNMRGKVYLNWKHWYIQQKYVDLTTNVYTHGDSHVEKALKEVMQLSVVSKIGHRRTECGDPKIGMTPEDTKTVFSEAALTGYVLGVWDHEQRLLGYLGGRIAAADADDGEAEVAG